MIETSFHQGVDHIICEDYAVFGQKDDSQYMIISDGCSSASYYNKELDKQQKAPTDIGARLLVKAAEANIHLLTDFNRESIEKFLSGILHCISIGKELFVLPLEAFFATLVVAKVIDNRVGILVYGDGVIVVKHKNGTRLIRSLDFSLNVPDYLAYRLDTSYVSVFDYVYNNEKNNYKVEFIDKISGYGNLTLSPYRTVVPDLDEVDSIFIFSDGVKAVEYNDEKVSVAEVIDRLTNIQLFNEYCITRRLRKFMEKDCKRLQWKPLDDISVGMIKFN